MCSSDRWGKNVHSHITVLKLESVGGKSAISSANSRDAAVMTLRSTPCGLSPPGGAAHPRRLRKHLTPSAGLTAGTRVALTLSHTHNFCQGVCVFYTPIKCADTINAALLSRALSLRLPTAGRQLHDHRGIPVSLDHESASTGPAVRGG